ncbi:hypothetical protein WMF26_13605 [Sorangium sp. So ce185]|uniref:hypothetical protein n=1 Tax=Sorangium sp. So ce185 TaxID=3133287 RepID=UPI003F628DF1
MKKLLWIGTVLLGALAPAQAAEPQSAHTAAPSGAVAAAPDGAAAGPRAETGAALPDGGEGAPDGGDGAAAPEPRALEEAPPAPERTPRPAMAEWDDAEPVRLARDKSGAACKARMRREWLRIDCTAPSLAAVRTLGASAGEAWFRLDQKNGEELASGVSVVFPVRRGDRRVIEILTGVWAYRGQLGISTNFMISEQWLDGDAGPLVSVL